MRILSNRKGFTLVELLIVVAIIGVLSTIGIPTFRSMVQKAKKSEAKVALGGLYTAEAAFFAEYGGYGNNLPFVGFELEGSGRIYSVGFSTSGCGAQDVAPANSSGPGRVIQQVIGAYYNGTPRTVYLNGNDADNSICATSSVEPEGNRFAGAAAGIIAGGAGTAANRADIWMINHRRNLTNCRDGVNGGGSVDSSVCESYASNFGPEGSGS